MQTGCCFVPGGVYPYWGREAWLRAGEPETIQEGRAPLRPGAAAARSALVTPVYNGRGYLREVEASRSVWAQTTPLGIHHRQQLQPRLGSLDGLGEGGE